MLHTKILLMMIGLCISSQLWAKEATVFDARRPISLVNDEVPAKDYYINAGSREGLKKGMSVAVYRRTNLYDQYQNKSLSDLVVLVGQLKIIHVQDDVSVARIEEIKTRENLPNVEFDTIMVGDKVSY